MEAIFATSKSWTSPIIGRNSLAGWHRTEPCRKFNSQNTRKDAGEIDKEK